MSESTVSVEAVLLSSVQKATRAAWEATTRLKAAERELTIAKNGKSTADYDLQRAKDALARALAIAGCPDHLPTYNAMTDLAICPNCGEPA